MLAAMAPGGLDAPNTSYPPPHGAPPWARRARLARLALCALLGGAGIALLAAPAAAGNTTRRLDRPVLAEIAVGPAAISDTTLPRRHLAFSAAGPPPGFWGGDYTTASGEKVTIYTSNSYAVDDAQNRRWAEFFASLLHSSELSQLTVIFAPLNEVQTICGAPDVLGCYGSNTIVSLGEDQGGVSVEGVLAHEYGHHVANNRSNAPWIAVDTGPKRWASYEQVCAKTRNHQLFPGGEDALTYLHNPGEGWAETYRVLNERRLGLTETPWNIVDRNMYPDATALSLAEQDVVSPWTANTTTTMRSSFTARGVATRTFRIATPSDGTLTVSVKGAAGERVSLSIHSTQVCGARTTVLQVKRVRGKGAFTLTVSRP